MTTTATDTTDEALPQLLDRIEIEQLVSRLGAWLDGRGGDPADLYAPDVVAVSPRGRTEGIDEVVRRVGPDASGDERFQHFHTDVVATVDGDRGVVTANQLLQAYFDGQVPHRTAGLRVTYAVRRLPEGWRLAELHIELQWIVGELPS
jgi:ketosteroid isomerase-like protein